jgi:hypothetical protein
MSTPDDEMTTVSNGAAVEGIMALAGGTGCVMRGEISVTAGAGVGFGDAAAGIAGGSVGIRGFGGASVAMVCGAGPG